VTLSRGTFRRATCESHMPFWACAQLQPRHEHLALCTLGLAGYETYLPRLRQHRVSHGRKIESRPPLFPGYLFVLIELQWHAARWSPGVMRLVLDSGVPARVPDRVIDEIRSRERGGLVDLPKAPRFKPGDRVRVWHGPFAGHVGLYTGMKPRERVEVLLAILGGSHRVELRADAVEAV
jgi:transcriptional antiterminator RfaH